MNRPKGLPETVFAYMLHPLAAGWLLVTALIKPLAPIAHWWDHLTR